MEQKKVDGRGFAIAYIAKALSIPRKSFNHWLSDKLGKSEETIEGYAVGKSPMRHWTYETFFEAIGEAIEEYLDYENISVSKRERVREKWEQEKEQLKEICRYFFMDEKAPERAADFPEPLQNIMEHNREMVKSFMPVFVQMDKQTAYKLQNDLQAYASVTSQDIEFVLNMIEMSKEHKAKLRTFMLQQKTVNAGTMLDRLKSEEVRHWVNIGNKTYKEVCKRGNEVEKSWVSFYEQFTTYYAIQSQLLIAFLLLILFAPNDEKTVRLDKKRFGVGEVDLLLLFKYCLTEAAQDEVLESWA